MKTRTTLFTLTLMLFAFVLAINEATAQTEVKGEILYDTNNLQVVKVWGTHYERGFAYGNLLSNEVGSTVNFFKLGMGSFYDVARGLVSVGGHLVIDSLYRDEAQGIVDGMGSAGYDTTLIDYLDILALSSWSDFPGYGYVLEAEPTGTTFTNWGEATAGTDLDGKTVAAHMYDWGAAYDALNNSVMVIHIPSEENLQPWIMIGLAGEMVPHGGGLNEGGVSCFKDAMTDFPTNMADIDKYYEPHQFTMRKALEYDDYNQDRKYDTYDVRDALMANTQGYATGHIIPISARFDPESDDRTAMVAEVAPNWPTHVFRKNTHNDTIPGDNLYAANTQIIRNNQHNYCQRYLNVATNMGNGTGISTEENWEIMKDHSHNLAGVNLGFIQHIPELNTLNLSVYRDETNAWQLPYTSFNLREFFNDAPTFLSSPELEAEVSMEYQYEIETTDPDPYDSLTIIDEQIPEWLSLMDYGDGTALLSGTPDETGMYLVKLKLSDGMEDKYQQFVITVHLPTVVAEKGENEPRIYPNPVKDQLIIEVSDMAELSILSISGEIIFNARVKKQQTFDFSTYPPGIYFIRLKTADKVVTKKIVKH